MRRRKAYEKPSERKTRERTEAIRRAQKAARKQAQREGLIPSPKRREDAPGRPEQEGGYPRDGYPSVLIFPNFSSRKSFPSRAIGNDH